MSWSYSKLSLYERCPQRKKYKYDDKIPVEVTQHPAAIRGSQMHEELELNVGKSIILRPADRSMTPYGVHTTICRS